MQISHIKIQNFRSIKDLDISIDKFNTFVGQNNSGKTNFFEAIDFFFTGIGKSQKIEDFIFMKDATNPMFVEITFSGAQDGVAQMQSPANKTKMETHLSGEDIVTFRRESNLPSKRKMFINNIEVNPGTGFDTALNDFLPKFEYINTKQYYESVAKYGKTTPIGIMLSGVLTLILQENDKYKAFQDKFKELFEDDTSEIRTEFDAIGNNVKVYLEKQFPDCSKVKFEVSPPLFEDLLKNFETSINDGVETLAEEKGDGMQRALMLAIIQVYADFRREHDDIGKSFLFFIDEAELHLHPSAQRNLKNVLHTLSENRDQVFINTHSSVLVADKAEGQTIYKVEKNFGETVIKRTDELDKPYIIYELLGGSPSDLLLPRNFLIVEGQSELELLSRVINRFYRDMPQIQIVKANGDTDQAERTINAIEKIFAPLEVSIFKEKVVILIDLPHPNREAGVNSFLDRNVHLSRNNQFFKLSKRDIEQCYPNRNCEIYVNWRKTQEELDAINGAGTKVITGAKKKQLAKHVGDNITKEEFESDLSICHEALKKCWELAF